jgi:hypothetical protein
MSDITQYIPDRNRKREYTEKQQSFLDNLVSAGGDAKIAADLAGYAPGVYPQVVRALKEENHRAGFRDFSTISSLKPAMKLVEVMEADAPIPTVQLLKFRPPQTDSRPAIRD